MIYFNEISVNSNNEGMLAKFSRKNSNKKVVAPVFKNSDVKDSATQLVIDVVNSHRSEYPQYEDVYVTLLSTDEGKAIIADSEELRFEGCEVN